MRGYDDEIEVTLTRIEIMTLLATTAHLGQDDDVELVRQKFGEKASNKVLKEDSGYSAYHKLLGASEVNE